MPLNLRRRFQKAYRRATYARRAAQPSAVILIYHRVCRLGLDPQMLAVTPEHFAKHLEIIRRDYHPISLLALAECVKQNRVPRGAVAVTFDDGYLDNLAHAQPVLARFEVPATVFAVSQYIGAGREFWWDDVERTLLIPLRTPSRLELRAGSAQDEHFSAPTASLAEREAAYRNLLPWMRRRTSPQLDAIRTQLHAWSDVPHAARPSHAVMNHDQLRELAAGGLVEIGAHTQHHPSLAALGASDQAAEIEGSKRELEQMLAQPVRSFSYPFGTHADYTPATLRLVRNAGFDVAPANWPDSVRAGADPWQLPRRLVRDWPANEFAAQLKNFFLPIE